jgi:tetratricopeptide (TPR) repeat protein
VDQLSLALRERFGESLRTIAQTRPLEQVTTGSHAALRVFSQGLQASNQGDDARSMQLLEEAIALDSLFAMAYRKLAIVLNNNDERRARAVEAATRAYELRDRLTERERYMVTAAYHSVVTGNRDQVISAYRTVLDMFPDDTYALNNLGVVYTQLNDSERAAEYYALALAVDSTNRLHYSNLASALGMQQKWDSATQVIERFAERFEGNPEVKISRIINAAYRKDYAAAEVLGAELMTEQRGTVFWEAIAYEWIAQLEAMRGRLTAAEQSWTRAFDITAERDLAGLYLTRAARRAITERLLRDDIERGRQILTDALRRYPLDLVEPLDRPYGHLALAFAAVDDTDRARSLLSEFERTPEADHSEEAELWREGAYGVIALAEGDDNEAIAALWRFADGNACETCPAPWLARVYERRGQADSARVMYERLVNTPSSAIWYDAGHLAQGYVRLGEMAEEAGNTELAVEYYDRLLELLDEAESEMQPLVERAREALVRLTAG